MLLLLARWAGVAKLGAAADAEHIVRPLPPCAVGDLEWAVEAVASAAEHMYPPEGDLVLQVRAGSVAIAPLVAVYPALWLPLAASRTQLPLVGTPTTSRPPDVVLRVLGAPPPYVIRNVIVQRHNMY